MPGLGSESAPALTTVLVTWASPCVSSHQSPFLENGEMGMITLGLAWWGREVVVEKNVISEPDGLLCVDEGEGLLLSCCQGAALPVSKKSSHRAEYPGDQAL